MKKNFITPGPDHIASLHGNQSVKICIYSTEVQTYKFEMFLTCLLPYVRLNIYILDGFTEKPNSKSLERNVVYTPITTSCQATSLTSK